MNKLSWPHIGSTESEMGSMKDKGNYRDFIEEGYDRLDSLTPEKFTSEDTYTSTYSYSGGRMSLPSEDPTSDNIFFEFLFEDNILDNSNILAVSDDIESLESFSSYNYNIYCLSKKSSLFSEKIVCESGDNKYYKFNKKFDIFYLKENNFDNLKLSFLNLNNQLKSKSYGYINTSLDIKNITKAAVYGGLNISNIKKMLKNYYKLSFNNLSNSKIIGVLGKDGNTKAAFVCDIADSFEKKISGLQAYSSIRNSFGLLFPYKKATDVLYHMGTVSYPIDIIFLDENSLIKKIEKNIQPGSPGLFTCSSVKNVLEIKGGMSNILDINIGDAVFIDSAESLGVINDKSVAIKKSKILPSSIYKYGSVSIKVDGISEFIEPIYNKLSKNIGIIDIDSILNYNVKINKVSKYNSGNVKNIICSSPKTISDEYKKILISKYALDELDSNYILPATYNSFSDGLNNKTKESIDNILKFKGNIVLATKQDFNFEKIASILNYKTNILFNKNFPEFQILRYSENDNLYHAAKNRFLESNLYFLNKKAGIPVPKEDADKAKEAENIFKKVKSESEDLLDNLKKNLTVYQGIQSDKNKIKNSKYEYNESVSRNTELLKKILIDIKKALKIMNEIKDVASTMEIISAIATSIMRSSKVVKEIFELVDSIENDDFIAKLTEKTDEAEKMFLDFYNSNQRMINYINSDILGVLVITP